MITLIPSVPHLQGGMRIFDCFLYSGESFMLYVRLVSLVGRVDFFVIGWSALSFSGQQILNLSFSPFENEIRTFRGEMHFVHIDFSKGALSTSSHRGSEIPWRREATARNSLLLGVTGLFPRRQDLVMLSDLDEICLPPAIPLIRAKPPGIYYNLRGTTYYYSFRWKLGLWFRPVIIRYGRFVAPLDSYRYRPIICVLPGILHHHCSCCFPTIGQVLLKFRSFSHTEYATVGRMDPHYLLARLLCGMGLLPKVPNWPERFILVPWNGSDLTLPADGRFDFLRFRIGFQDLDTVQWNISKLRDFMPADCNALASSGLHVCRLD
jgi:hypothetical protein